MNVVITGGTKGIGKAMCLAFAGKGHNVATCSRHSEDLVLWQEEMEGYCDSAICLQADLSEKQDVERFGAFVMEQWKEIDVLINNAGVFIPGQLLEEEETNLDFMIRTNVYSAYQLSRMLVPKMVERKSGHVFNICSVASIMAYPNGGSYSISKFALLGFSKVLREELKTSGVKVTSVMPGATWSDSWAGVDLPHERLMPAEDIAALVLAAAELGPSTVLEELIIRPQLGDL